MKKILIIILCVLTVIILIVNKKETPFDTNYKKNIVGNNPNNGWYVAMQGDWFYYYDVGTSIFNPAGLYRIKKDGSNKVLMDKGKIYNINVVGDWVYYIKNVDDKNDDLVVYNHLYRIRLDGTGKKKIVENAINSYVTNDKIYYRIGIETVGPIEIHDVDYPIDQDRYIFTCDLDGENKEVLIDKIVDGMVIFNNYLYYKENGNLYRLNLIDKSVDLLISSYSISYCTWSEKYIYFYDDEDKAIYTFDLNNKSIEKILDNIDNLSVIKIIGDFLYLRGENDNKLLKVFDLETGKIKEYEVDGSIYSFNNIPYILNNGKIYELSFD